MRVLVTGASGFIGRHVVRSIHGSGFTIIRATRNTVEGLSEAFALDGRSWDLDIFRYVLAISRPDLVIHCVGATHALMPSTFFTSNACLASDLLSAADAAAHRPRIILVGSAAEYGYVPPDAMPVSEDHPPEPATTYAISKYAQTLLGMAAFDRGLQVLTLRVFNAIGIGMPENLAIPSFARRIMTSAKNETPISVGNLDVKRDFIHVDEVCKAIFALALIPEWRWPVANLCSGVAVPLKHVFDQLLIASGVNCPVIVEPNLQRQGEMLSIYGSTSRLRSVGITASPPDFRDLAPKIIDWHTSNTAISPR